MDKVFQSGSWACLFKLETAMFFKLSHLEVFLASGAMLAVRKSGIPVNSLTVRSLVFLICGDEC